MLNSKVLVNEIIQVQREKLPSHQGIDVSEGPVLVGMHIGTSLYKYQPSQKCLKPIWNSIAVWHIGMNVCAVLYVQAQGVVHNRPYGFHCQAVGG